MAQKIPLFNGLIKACHDGVAGAIVTPVFSPPDKTLATGSQAYYALHLWLKPAHVTLPAQHDEYILQAKRGSNPADVRPIWSSDSQILRQVTGTVATLTQVNNFDGVPVKILDGYVVRGDVTIELSSEGSADRFADANGTKLWGYYQRIGAVNEGYRFIGDPPVGPLFDTGLPTSIGPGETKTVHTFDPDRIDEIWLEIAALLSDTALAGAITILLVDSNGAVLSQLDVLQDQVVLGAPNGIRDPVSPYDFHGVFGNNDQLDTLQIKNNDVATTVFVHGRFARH